MQKVERATTIAEGGVNVHTVEHVISALAGMGVDNAIIEMDANEPPIADGSSMPFVQLIKSAGLQEQKEARKVFEVREPMYQETRDGTILTIVPDKKFRISCTNVGPGGRFTQYFSTEINPETYEKDIAAARTFVYYEDIAPLMEKGLIKGGTLEAAVVIRGDTLLSKQPLRFADEFVRHKILDIVGDLMLSGKRILGHVIAVRPGHGPNTELARAIVQQYNQMRSMVPAPVNIPGGESVLDINEVMSILPTAIPSCWWTASLASRARRSALASRTSPSTSRTSKATSPAIPSCPACCSLRRWRRSPASCCCACPATRAKSATS